MNLLLAVEGGGFPDPFPINELFEFDSIFGGDAWWALNRVGLLYLLAGGIVCVLMVVAFRQPKLVPDKFQNAMESLVQFVREQIAIQVIGPDGRRFVPLLTAIFLFVWVNNFFEVTPFIQFPSTGRMAVPAFLAIVVWTMFVLLGIKQMGIKYFIVGIIPSGVPGWLKPAVWFIEFISTFLVRPLTLAVRLFANMMAGHILLAILFIAANAFLLDVHDLGSISFNLRGSPIGLIALAFGPAMVAFEIMVGALQAYIFTILTAVYIAGSVHPDH